MDKMQVTSLKVLSERAAFSAFKNWDNSDEAEELYRHQQASTSADSFDGVVCKISQMLVEDHLQEITYLKRVEQERHAKEQRWNKIMATVDMLEAGHKMNGWEEEFTPGEVNQIEEELAANKRWRGE